MGLRFVGPQHPHGRRAEPRPQELPEDSNDVPTYRHRHDPAAATTSSRRLAGSIGVVAGPSAPDVGSVLIIDSFACRLRPHG
jgi:hypothetical protein